MADMEGILRAQHAAQEAALERRRLGKRFCRFSCSHPCFSPRTRQAARAAAAAELRGLLRECGLPAQDEDGAALTDAEVREALAGLLWAHGAGGGAPWALGSRALAAAAAPLCPRVAADSRLRAAAERLAHGRVEMPPEHAALLEEAQWLLGQLGEAAGEGESSEQLQARLERAFAAAAARGHPLAVEPTVPPVSTAAAAAEERRPCVAAGVALPWPLWWTAGRHSSLECWANRTAEERCCDPAPQEEGLCIARFEGYTAARMAEWLRSCRSPHWPPL